MSLTRISPEAAQGLMRDDGYQYVDVRSELEFALGHPAGAFNVPWQHADPATDEAEGPKAMRDNTDFMAVMRDRFPVETPLIIGCRTGHRSQLAALRLLAAGYERVVEMRGGFAGTRDAFGRVVAVGWQDASLPVEYEARPGRSYAALTDD